MGKNLIRFLVNAGWLITASIFLVQPVQADRSFGTIPSGAFEYAPVLVSVQEKIWPGAEEPWTLAGLIEQESCISLKHRRCWNPKAELKTSREYGFGFGQITVAYREDGSTRFNKFEELRAQHKSLRGWKWEERYDPDKQLVAVVEMVRSLYDRVLFGLSTEDRWAFTLSSYNGGLSGVLQDRTLCAKTEGCDPRRWFGHIEVHSLKSKTPKRAYGGQSWFSINRGHVRNVLTLRRDKYRQFWEG